VRVVVAIVLLLLPTSVFAQGKRIALLIGNRAYDASVGALTNPHNDIAVVGEVLAKQGFEILPLIKDARRSATLGGVRELARRLNTEHRGRIVRTTGTGFDIQSSGSRICQNVQFWAASRNLLGHAPRQAVACSVAWAPDRNCGEIRSR
jgi:hypothetical protein